MNFRVLALTIVALLGVFEVISIAAETRTIVADSEPTRASIGNAVGGHTYKFEPYEGGTYTIIVESYQTNMVAWVSRDNYESLIFLAPTKEGPYRYRTEVDFAKEEKYIIGVGIQSKKNLPAIYRIGIYRNPDAQLPLDSSLNFLSLKPGIEKKINLSDSNEAYLGHPAIFFIITLKNSDKRWVQTKVDAKGFVPIVLLFDISNQETLGKTLYSQDKLTSENVAFIQDEKVGVVIYAHDLGLDVDIKEIGTCRIVANLVEHDPNRPFKERLSEQLRDPVVTLLIGTIITALFSYIFYRRSVVRKRIIYSLQADRLVLHSVVSRNSCLSVSYGDVPVVDNVGVCNALVYLKSHRDISSEDVRRPIRLQFKNIDRILRATADATDGWQNISIPEGSPATVELQIDHLEPRDEISISVFYTQEELKNVSMTATGSIHDSSIKEESKSFAYWRNVIFLMLFVVIILNFMFLLLDDWLNFISVRKIMPFRWLLHWTWYIVMIYFLTDAIVLQKIRDLLKRANKKQNGNRKNKHFESELKKIECMQESIVD